jgi:predicted small lipoprotein YifL
MVSVARDGTTFYSEFMRESGEVRSMHRGVTILLGLFALAACGDKPTGPETADNNSAAPERAEVVASVTQEPGEILALSSFAGRDADHDGLISSAEMSSAAAKVFSALDSDGNGSVSVAEMDQGRRAMGLGDTPSSEKVIAASDNDGDKALTLAEWVGASNQDFVQTDINKDELIDGLEWRARNESHSAQRGQPAPAGQIDENIPLPKK